MTDPAKKWREELRKATGSSVSAGTWVVAKADDCDPSAFRLAGRKLSAGYLRKILGDPFGGES